MMLWSLRRATNEDDSFLQALFTEAHADEFLPIGLPEPALANLLAMQYRGQVMTYTSQFPNAESSIICREAARAGRVLVDVSQREIRLIDIALTREYQRRGIGGEVVRELGEQARSRGLPLRLSVRLGNPAERLYLRAGLEVIAENETHREMELR